MILKDNNGTTIRVGDVRTMCKVDFVEGNPKDSRYCIEMGFRSVDRCYSYAYGTAKDARDADFERVNRAMDALDGIQQ